MGDVLRFPGPRWVTIDTTGQPAPPSPFERPTPALPAAPLPADGFAVGARVWDKISGARGTVRGATWSGADFFRKGRPLKYAVEWDGDPVIEDVVACRLIPARPVLAPRPAGQPGLTTLHVRRITRAPWWPGKSLSADGGDDPKGAA
ncbi:hypothetical protein [Inquilinus sp. CA228]|uniref:hypothetical protein n=1 Tax=Inquilinus sp. CA228 TaxID=3455609 RepID=UPI003F8D2199